MSSVTSLVRGRNREHASLRRDVLTTRTDRILRFAGCLSRILGRPVRVGGPLVLIGLICRPVSGFVRVRLRFSW
jgi:hypothetical protein